MSILFVFGLFSDSVKEVACTSSFSPKSFCCRDLSDFVFSIPGAATFLNEFPLVLMVEIVTSEPARLNGLICSSLMIESWQEALLASRGEADGLIKYFSLVTDVVLVPSAALEVVLRGLPGGGCAWVTSIPGLVQSQLWLSCYYLPGLLGEAAASR